MRPIKVIIFAYDFPPSNSVGAQRPYSWLKHFNDFGIYPVVITRHWDAVSTADDRIRPSQSKENETLETEFGTILRVPFLPNIRDRILLKYGEQHAVIRRILSLWYSMAQYVFASSDNRRNMLDAAREYVKKNPCDIIIATGEPFILFHYAKILSKEFGIPWIADYRDGWSTNYHLQSTASGLDQLINNLYFTPLEKRIVATSALITTAAPAIRTDLCKLHPTKNAKVIFNGFFPEMFETLTKKEKRTNQPFIIAYSGTLYPYQKLNMFIDGFEKFVRLSALSPSEIQVHFLGLEYQPDQMKRLLDYKPDLNKYIKITGRMPHSESLIVLNQADVLLLLTNARFGQIYAKVFDYVALGKPILMCENDQGPLEQILNDAGTGHIADNSDQVCEQLSSLYETLPSATINAAHVQQYSRKYQAERLANFIKSFLQNK
jgi:glycosyltransferase involved in cell wall biosynthesis